MSRPERLRLFDILHAIEVCGRAMAGVNEAAFESDWVRRFAVERALEVVSEASRHLSAESRDLAPEVPWRRLADLGNVTRHGYDIVAPQEIWLIVQRDLPAVKAACERLYERVKRPADPWPDPA